MEENLNNQNSPVQQPQVEPQVTPSVEQPQMQENDQNMKKGNKNKILIIAGVVSLLFLAFLLFFLNRNKSSNTPNTNITFSPTPVPTFVPSTDNLIDENWQVHAVTELGIEYQLPKTFSSFDYPDGYESAAETGTQICLQYNINTPLSFLVKNVFAGGTVCFPENFGIGATSLDFQAGRMGGFGDLQGFSFENGKYYALGPVGKKYEIYQNETEKITNKNGVEILKITDPIENTIDQGDQIDGTNFPSVANPGDGRIAALVNLGGENYTGFTIQMKLGNYLTEELFDQILSTIKVVDTTSF